MTSDPPTSAPQWSGTARTVRGSTVLEEVSAGRAVAAGGPPCSAGLRHQAGSISKLVVSAVVLRLVEQGRVGLDDPVTRSLPGSPAAWDGITLRHLLGQTSGMGHWGDVVDLPADFLTAPPRRDELVRLVAATPLLGPPGWEWRYSGPGFLVAALVVEAVAGVPYGEVAAALVLGPAGLRSTTSGVHPTTSDGIARGHRGGRLLPLAEGFTDLPGTGDLWTTVGDLVTLNQALRAGVVLGQESAALLWTPYAATPGPVADGVVVTEAYGFGTFLGRVKGHRARIHPGDNPGYQSLLAYLPDEDVDVVVLCNDEAPAVDAALMSLTSL